MSKAICKKAIPEMGIEFVLFGTNKIFLRLEATAKLDKLRAEKLFKKDMAARKF